MNHDDQVADPTSNVQRPEQQVWTAEVENGMPRLLGTLNCQEEGCEDIEVSPDGQTAVWAARGQLWIAPVSGAVPAQQLCYVRGENDQPRWSPDGKKLAFVSHRGDHSFIVVYDRGRQTLLYLAPSVDRDQLPRWSPDSRQVIFTREPGAEAKLPIIPVRASPWSIWIADAESGEGHAVWHSGAADNDSYPQLTEEGSLNVSADGHIIFSSEQDGWNHLYSMPVAGGQPTLLTPGEFEVENVSMSADGRSVVFSSNQDDIDRRHIWRVSAAGGKPEALSKGETIEWAPAETGDGRFVVCLGSTATSPAMPYVLRAGGRDMLARESFPADFPSAQLVTPKQVTFQSEDGFTIHGQLFVPKGRSGAGPALVFMHGGSRRQMMLGFHYMQYYHNSYSENQYLASQGFVVLSINYRTGIMYGRAFREPVNGGWRGASEYKDVVAAGKYLQTLPIVDAHKIGLWGGSYGGFLTAMGLSRNSEIFAAGVDMHGVHDWSARGFVGGGGAAGAPDMAAAAKLAWESSPDSTIGTWKSPVLLIQGDDDRNVAFSQMVDLVQRLRAQHVPFEQIVFPDEIHDFLMWKSWVRAYKAEADFFQRVLVRGETISTNN